MTPDDPDIDMRQSPSRDPSRARVITSDETSEQGVVPVEPQEHWMRSFWRPIMAILYSIICAFDFILAPIGWTMAHVSMNEQLEQWVPLTLQAGGLFHVAMGAVLGVAAWTRGQEKRDRITYGRR